MATEPSPIETDSCRQSLTTYGSRLVPGCPKLTVTTLRLIAKDCGLSGYSRLKKADLCLALQKRLEQEPNLVVAAVEAAGVEIPLPGKQVDRPAFPKTEEDKALKAEYCRCVFEQQSLNRREAPSLCESRYRRAGKTKPTGLKCRYKQSFLDGLSDREIKGYAEFRQLLTKRLQRPEIQKQVEEYLAKRSQLLK